MFMEQIKQNKKWLIAIIIVLLLINAVALIISGHSGRKLIEYTILYVVEIIVTIWCIIDGNIFTKKKSK